MQCIFNQGNLELCHYNCLPYEPANISPSTIKYWQVATITSYSIRVLLFVEMANKVEPLMEAVHGNPHLQSSLESILVNTATASYGMRDVFDIVSHLLYK